MKATAKRAALTVAAVLGTVGAVLAADPLVSDVTMTQITDTRMVAITYKLADAPAIVTLSIEIDGVAIPDSKTMRVTGDVSKLVQPGLAAKSILWNAGEDWPENFSTIAKARVTAWHTNSPPLYCAVDVLRGPSASTYPAYYYTSSNAVPGGVTSDLYKTTQILLRKLPATGAQGFSMGAPTSEPYNWRENQTQHNVVLSKDFYAGVYEVTQSQWLYVMGDIKPWPSHFSNPNYRLMRPVDQVSPYHIREITDNGGGYWGTDDPAVDWPHNDHVTPASFIGRLRTKTGLNGFDLPTEAQWEYACRAGTTGVFNDGTITMTDYMQDENLARLGRYRYNGGASNPTPENPNTWNAPNDSPPEIGSAIVGSYIPNAWGLYDMHGNLWEWCLDKYQQENGSLPATDPVGASGGAVTIMRGGSWLMDAHYSRSAYRYPTDYAGACTHQIGFRLFRNIEPYLTPAP